MLQQKARSADTPLGDDDRSGGSPDDAGSSIRALRCLWVEDEPDEVTGFRAELAAPLTDGGFGWIVHDASNKADAVKLLRQSRYDILILDVMMPNNSVMADESLLNIVAGLQLLQQIGAEDWQGASRTGAQRNIHAIVMWTALISSEIKAKIMDIIDADGDDRYLEKPVDDLEFQNAFRPYRDHEPSGNGGEQRAGAL